MSTNHSGIVLLVNDLLTSGSCKPKFILLVSLQKKHRYSNIHVLAVAFRKIAKKKDKRDTKGTSTNFRLHISKTLIHWSRHYNKMGTK